MKDIINVDNPYIADNRFQDGALPHVSGVKSFQVMRANRSHPEMADHIGWTYNHAPMICYAFGRFFVEYLSNPVSEHEVPGHTLLTSSTDGINWSVPEVIFPEICVDTDPYLGPKSASLKKQMLTVPHQRMGFYYASNHVLLVLSFYGIVHDRKLSAPCDGWGIGRAVRKINPDGSVGDKIWFFMYNEAAGFNRDNTPYFAPYYESDDKEFVKACQELEGNKAVISQMYEEQRFDKKLFHQKLPEALSFYTAADGKMVGVFKKSMASISLNKGETWTEPAYQKEICTSTGKVWGQKTSDQKYALLYNPTPDTQHRWPIAMVTGNDGYHFGHMGTITGEMSPQRYGGLDKNLGPQYLRGIIECNPQPEDNNLWMTYSNNKEDIWVSEIPIPAQLTGKYQNELTFEKEFPDELGIYSPIWAPVRIEDNKIRMKDYDPYDRCCIEFNVKESKCGSIWLEFEITSVIESSSITIELQDSAGRTPVQLVFGGDYMVYVRDGGRRRPWIEYGLNKLISVKITFNGDARRYELSVNDKTEKFQYAASVEKICRCCVSSKDKILQASSLDSDGKFGTKEQILKDCEVPLGETELDVSRIGWNVTDNYYRRSVTVC